MAPLVFAVTWQRNAEPIGPRMAEVVAAVAERARVRIVPRVALSYGELARLLRERLADVAWLPPIPFVELRDEGVLAPLVTHIRGSSASYESVLLVRKDSTATSPEDLRGSTAGWVDPWSAAGYVLPRVELFDRGLDPRALFTEEKFFGSHDAAVRALMNEKADTAATFAQLGSGGEVLRSGFAHVPGASEAVRVLARFGPIPCDVIATHASIPAEVQASLTEALVHVARDERWAASLARVFGVDEFRPGPPGSYDALGALLARARAAKLFDA